MYCWDCYIDVSVLAHYTISYLSPTSHIGGELAFQSERYLSQNNLLTLSTAVRGPKYWNLLPVSLNIIPPLSLFKVNLKEYLVSQ